MVLNKKEFERAFSPYRKEAKHCLMKDVFLAFALCILIAIFVNSDKNLIVMFWIIPLYFFIECAINYRLAIITMIEEHKRCVITKNVLIENKKNEWSPSGPRYSDGAMPFLYPKGMKVERYKIKCTDISTGKKIYLRCAMSLKNAELLNKMLACESTRNRTVIIGKYSHIIIKYCDKDDFAFALSRRLWF